VTYRPTATTETLRLRARMLARTRAFFAARGVLEVETPSLSESAPTDPALESVEVAVRALARPHYLHTSPELAMKRLLAAGAGDMYQICRVFRDGELGRWHQPEFTMLEWYRLGWDDDRLMDEVEALVRDALDAETTRKWPAERITYRNAFVRALGVDPLRDARSVGRRLAEHGIEVPAGLDDDALLDLALGTVVAPGFAREALTFVHDYPRTQAALARLKPGEPKVAARFELFAGGLELANGFAELTDAREQRRRFYADQAIRRRRGLPTRPVDEDFLDALEQGLPACAGVALGFDRLVAVTGGLASLAEALAFAHVPPG